MPADAAVCNLVCPHCRKSMRISGATDGQSIRCTHCGQPVSAAPGGTTQTPAAADPAKCPACGASVEAGAVTCLDCGYMLRRSGPPTQLGPPNLCFNPECGVANPLDAKVCVRCSSPLPALPGTLLRGRYTLDKCLKIGGFGLIYRATDTEDNRPVVIKELFSPDPAEFNLRLEFFFREAHIMRTLSKGGSAAVPEYYGFDHTEEDHTAYLIMEFIPGRNLLDTLEANGSQPFEIPLVIEWGKRICDLLAVMHGQSPSLIHRDIKPDNIMLLEDQRTIKMIDFGTARELRVRDLQESKLTRIYTGGYAPKEQIEGKPEPRSDLYALAVTLYQLATGTDPQRPGADPASDLAEELAKANPLWPAEYRWFFEFLAMNLSDAVAARSPSAAEFKRALEHERVLPPPAPVTPVTPWPNPIRTPTASNTPTPVDPPPRPPTQHTPATATVTPQLSPRQPTVAPSDPPPQWPPVHVPVPPAQRTGMGKHVLLTTLVVLTGIGTGAGLKFAKDHFLGAQRGETTENRAKQ